MFSPAQGWLWQWKPGLGRVLGGGAGVSALEAPPEPRAQPEHPAGGPLPGSRRDLAPAVPPPPPSALRGRRRPSGAGTRTAQARGGGGTRGREPGGFPSALPPPTGAENVICCAFQARFPGVTSPSRPGRGRRQRGEAGGEGTPRGGRRGAGGGGSTGKGGGRRVRPRRRRLANGEARPRAPSSAAGI